MRRVIVILTSIAAMALPASAAMAKTGITEATARRIALSLVKDGTVKSVKLEREHGTRIYSFDISQPNKSGIEEIQVRAKNGKVISQRHETDAEEAAEATKHATEQ